jgi:hypothetical protein
MTVPKNLGEVKSKRLAGYELMTGYYLELSHGLMGAFPALISEEEELFVCTDKKLLEKVWEKLPKRKARVSLIQLYVNLTEKVGYNVLVGNEAEPIHVLSEEEFDSLKDRVEPFMWSPGLGSLRGGVDVKSPFE